jgi:hypothetical protein
MQISSDYYQELELQEGASLEELQKQLVQLRKDWVNRQAVYPEKANLMIVLLDGADKAFADEKSRAEYDRDLAESKKSPESKDPEAERRENFERWYETATQYYDNDQHDLANTALSKALQYKNPDLEDAKFFLFAADVTRRNNNPRQALEYINQSLLYDADDPEAYLFKAFALEDLEDERSCESGGIKAAVQEEKDVLDLMLKKALKNDDVKYIAIAYGMLALVWYRKVGSNESVAEDFAQKALATGKSNDEAESVLKDIAKARRKKAEEEQRRAEKKARNKPILEEMAWIDGELNRLGAETGGMTADQAKSQKTKARGLGCLGSIGLIYVAVIMLISGISLCIATDYTGSGIGMLVTAIVIFVVFIRFRKKVKTSKIDANEVLEANEKIKQLKERYSQLSQQIER